MRERRGTDQDFVHVGHERLDQPFLDVEALDEAQKSGREHRVQSVPVVQGHE